MQVPHLKDQFEKQVVAKIAAMPIKNILVSI